MTGYLMGAVPIGQACEVLFRITAEMTARSLVLYGACAMAMAYELPLYGLRARGRQARRACVVRIPKRATNTGKVAT